MDSTVRLCQDTKIDTKKKVSRLLHSASINVMGKIDVRHQQFLVIQSSLNQCCWQSIQHSLGAKLLPEHFLCTGLIFSSMLFIFEGNAHTLYLSSIYGTEHGLGRSRPTIQWMLVGWLKTKPNENKQQRLTQMIPFKFCRAPKSLCQIFVQPYVYKIMGSHKNIE